jgi:transglutaminase-like putative cysteine protease
MKTVALMMQYALRDSLDPEMQKLAKYFNSFKEPQWKKARRVFKYAVGKIPYCLDPEGKEQVTRPVHTLSGQKDCEDCDGQATALASIFLAMGWECRFVVIAWRMEKFTHVYMQVRINDWTGKYKNGIWLPLDAVMGKKGYANAKEAVYKIHYALMLPIIQN